MRYNNGVHALLYRRSAGYCDGIIQWCPECCATGTPRNSRDIPPEIHSTSGRICSPRGKRVRLAAGAVSNFADATSCVHVRGFHRRPADALVHATEVRVSGCIVPACSTTARCTTEDLGHPKTVAGAVPREFLVSLLWKIMRTGRGRENRLRGMSFAKL